MGASAFELLRPKCVALSQIAFLPPGTFNPTSLELLNALKSLYNELNRVTGKQQPALADYVFVPISSLLKHSSLGESQTEYLLLIISKLLDLCWSDALPQELGTQLLSLVCFLTGGPPKAKEISEKSTALRMAGVTCLNSLFNCRGGAVFTRVENSPILGHCVTILLEITNKETDVKLQLECVNTLSLLYANINDGEVLSFILPGNVSILSKVILKPGVTTHYSVIIQVLKLLEQLLVIVYNDQELNVVVKSANDMVSNSTTEIPLSTNKHRNDSWLRATSAQVRQALKVLFDKLVKHDKKSVQDQLLHLMESLLHSCEKTLRLDDLFVDYLPLLNPSTDIVISQQAIVKSCDSLMDVLRSNFQLKNEDSIVSVMHKLQFSVERYEGDNELLFHIVDLLQDQISHYVGTLKVNSVKIQATSLTVEEFHKKSLFNFERIFGSELETAIASVLQSIGAKTGNFKNLGGSKTEDRFVQVWVATQICKGFDTLLVMDPPDCCYSLLEYSSDLLQDLVTAENTVINNHASSAAIDAISTVATIMGSDFQSELIDYLYPVIDGLASSSEEVREHAQQATLVLAGTCYGNNITEMIMDNVDYLVDAVSIRLSNTITVRASSLLMVLMKLAGFKILASFGDVMEMIFNLLDYYHGYDALCIEFFQLFEIIVDEMKRIYIGDHLTLPYNEHSSYKPWGMTNIDQLIQLLETPDPVDTLEEVYTDGEVGDSDDETDDDDDASQGKPTQEEDDEEKAWTSPIPKNHYKLLEQIIRYSERLLTHPSKALKLQILRTLNKVIPLLASSYNDMLPHIASIWDLLARLCVMDDLAVMSLAADAIEKCITFAGDFIARRFIELWESLKQNNTIVNQLMGKSSQQNSKSIVKSLPTLTLKTTQSLCDMLLSGIYTNGHFVDDYTTEKIVSFAVIVHPQVEYFKISYVQDVAWFILNKESM